MTGMTEMIHVHGNPGMTGMGRDDGDWRNVLTGQRKYGPTMKEGKGVYTESDLTLHCSKLRELNKRFQVRKDYQCIVVIYVS
jgi:hypothetical protein